MPPCWKYSTSLGVSIRTRAVNSLSSGADADLLRLAVLDPGDRELLLAGQPERLGRLAVGELQRQHAHADEVRAVDALERLRDHGAHAEQVRALRRPVARRARAVLLAGEHDQRLPSSA